jgi:hypothetical protein
VVDHLLTKREFYYRNEKCINKTINGCSWNASSPLPLINCPNSSTSAQNPVLPPVFLCIRVCRSVFPWPRIPLQNHSIYHFPLLDTFPRLPALTVCAHLLFSLISVWVSTLPPQWTKTAPVKVTNDLQGWRPHVSNSYFTSSTSQQRLKSGSYITGKRAVCSVLEFRWRKRSRFPCPSLCWL